MFSELVKKNRSYRRFDESFEIDRDTLVQLVEYARLSPFGANIQCLKFMIFNGGKENDIIFNNIHWGAFLPHGEGTPKNGERPSGYILILNDTKIGEDAGINTGIAAQTMLLGAVEKGLGGCMIASVKRGKLKEELGLAEHLNIAMVVALGKPTETVVIEEVGEDGNVKYWRSEDNVHHVPKRSLDELLIE